MNKPRIPAELIQAYTSTHYHVFSSTEFTLKIGQYSAELHALYSQTGTDSSVFITECNPYSEPLSNAQNKLTQQTLIENIEAAGYKFQHGEGKHTDTNWPGEKSIFILGHSKEASIDLGKEYGQNAVVWTGSNAVPELLITL